MRIPLDEIPEEGIEVHFSEKESLLADALAVTPPPPAGTSLDPRVTGYIHITGSGEDIFLVGKVQARMTLQCSRCLAHYMVDCPLDLNLVIRRRPGDLSPVDAEFESVEAEAFYVSGDELDPGELILQELYLDHPLKPLCSEDCPGLCPKCGNRKDSEACKCAEGGPADPRWEALAKLRDRLTQ